jgi:ABC-type multidrug transport system ATPase subunit
VKAVLENADVVYVLNQGQLLASGTPEEVAADPVVRSEYLGSILDLEENPDVGTAETLAEEADEVIAELVEQVDEAEHVDVNHQGEPK